MTVTGPVVFVVSKKVDIPLTLAVSVSMDCRSQCGLVLVRPVIVNDVVSFFYLNVSNRHSQIFNISHWFKTHICFPQCPCDDGAYSLVRWAHKMTNKPWKLCIKASKRIISLAFWDPFKCLKHIGHSFVLKNKIKFILKSQKYPQSYYSNFQGLHACLSLLPEHYDTQSVDCSFYWLRSLGSIP